MYFVFHAISEKINKHQLLLFLQYAQKIAYMVLSIALTNLLRTQDFLKVKNQHVNKIYS